MGVVTDSEVPLIETPLCGHPCIQAFRCMVTTYRFSISYRMHAKSYPALLYPQLIDWRMLSN